MRGYDANPRVVETQAIREGYFKEGEAVVYHSRTQGAFLRTRITKIHGAGGLVEAIDLACKNRADLTKISKLRDLAPQRSEGLLVAELPSPLHGLERRVEARVVDGAESPCRRFFVGDKVLYNSKSLSQRVVATVERMTSDGHYDLDIKKSADPKNMAPFTTEALIEKEERAGALNLRDGTATPQGFGAADFVASRYTGEGRIVSCKVSPLVAVSPRRQRSAGSGVSEAEHGRVEVATDARLPLQETKRYVLQELQELPNAVQRRFEAGEKVIYNSKSLSQRVVATVERMTSDGHYDLDIKKSADPKNMAPFTEAFVRAESFREAPAEHRSSAVQLPIHLRADGTPTPQGDATPLGFGAADFVASRHTGEGRIVSCKVSMAIPVGPRQPSPARTPTPVVASKSFFPPMTPTAATPKAGSAGAELIAKLCSELHVGSGFDPNQPMQRQQLLQKLQLRETASIKEMGGFKGGLNQGIWIVRDGQQLVLKQSRCERTASSILSEAENFVRIAKDHPQIAQDPLVAFPVKIFSCIGSEGDRLSDLIVMKKSPGERLCEFVAQKFYAKQFRGLNQAIEQVGARLAQFHARYCEQHGDFQPSNIYYEEATGVVTLIDVGGMGVPTLGNDVDHFHQCIRAMTASYHANLHIELLRAFDKGYRSSVGSPPSICIATSRPMS